MTIEEMEIKFIVEFISNHGFPIFMVLCIAYIVYYIWKFVTLEVKPFLINILELLNKLAEDTKTVENDVEKLNQKVSIINVIKNDSHRPS